MDIEKMRFDDHSGRSRATALVKQHRPFIAFLLFATFVLTCMHLPWGGPGTESAGTPATPAVVEPVFDPSYNKTLTPGNGTIQMIPENNQAQKPRFAKIAVASGFEDIVYERALDTHFAHAKKHGYPMYMARENAAEGMFNKIAYIMDVLLNELFKPAEDRVEWLFYFDADSIIMNQEVPLEIFEPPSDFKHINWMAGKDFNGLNAGVFLLRVNTWSLNLLTRCMTYKTYHPDEEYVFEEQTILARLTENDEEFKGQSIYVPKAWFNAYFYSLHEVKPGLLLSHFPHPDYKWHIYEWLRVLESDKDSEFTPVYNIPIQETTYPAEIKGFWNAKRRADKAIKGFEKNVHRGADPIQFGMQHDETKKLAEQFRGKLDELKKASISKTDEFEQLNKLVQETEELDAKLIQELMAYFETHDNPPPVAGF
ncbi:gb [Venturia nashicola]|uniref:Gb n=1 Tax=Venturia nashicola TaxID=86259 RepID=A0A4Z1PBF8_9PEZI|nr:gb [Venturia nashicola]TLD37822.1 gb [Venturia nashicola]